MTPQTTAILTKIREVCPELMELSFGCEVEVLSSPKGDKIQHYNNEFVYIFGGHINSGTESASKVVFAKCANPFAIQYSVFEKWEDKIKTIGHEPHLEHLLRVISAKDKDYVLDMYGQFRDVNGFKYEFYNFTLSLTQNLENNQELREFVYELICE